MKAGAIMIFLSWSTFSLANGGGYGSGVNIQGNPTAGEIARNKFSPVNLQKIEMQTEDLEIDLFAETAAVRRDHSRRWRELRGQRARNPGNHRT